MHSVGHVCPKTKDILVLKNKTDFNKILTNLISTSV